MVLTKIIAKGYIGIVVKAAMPFFMPRPAKGICLLCRLPGGRRVGCEEALPYSIHRNCYSFLPCELCQETNISMDAERSLAGEQEYRSVDSGDAKLMFDYYMGKKVPRTLVRGVLSAYFIG